MELKTSASSLLNIFTPNAEGIRGQHVAFLASLSSPEVIFEQIPVIHALPKLFVASFTLVSVLPIFTIGTSERKEDEGGILPLLLLRPGFCRTYQFQEEDQHVWSHSTFMPCKCTISMYTPFHDHSYPFSEIFTWYFNFWFGF
jgi:hypothetical protein